MILSVNPLLPEPLLAFEPVSPALARALAEVDAARIAYLEATAQGRVLPNVTEALRIELTYHSNAIEGNTLSLRETQLVIEGHAPPSGKSMRELYEARNHDRALRLVEEWAVKRGAAASITETDVLDVHRAVLTDIDPRSAGVLRSDRVRISGTRFIPPGSHRFPQLLSAMLDRVNRPDAHPVLQAAEFHYNLVAIHPFTDGNGRTTRLMMNYHLLRHGYPLVIIEVGERAEYLSALDDANAGVWERFANLVARSAERSIRRTLGD